MFRVINITTNGFVKKNGSGVMGAGVAKQAREKFKGIESDLGNAVKQNGNVCQIIKTIQNINGTIWILAFPTKHNWWEKSNLELIEKSTKELVALTDKMQWNKVVLPRPGCNNGQRKWLSEVKPILKKYLDDRFYVITL